MGRAAASPCARLLWATALMLVMSTLAVTTATTAAAAAPSCGCCCPCQRGTPVGDAADPADMAGTVQTQSRPVGAKGDTAKGDTADFVEMDGTARTKPRPMGAAVDAGAQVETTQFSTFVRLVARQPMGAA